MADKDYDEEIRFATLIVHVHTQTKYIIFIQTICFSRRWNIERDTNLQWRKTI